MAHLRASLVVHAISGWAICGATIGIGRTIASMHVTLIVHALVAPLAFGLLTWNFVRRHPRARPMQTALAMLSIVVALDAFVVAPLFEYSYAMFRSLIGTWIPFASIGLASYFVAWRMIQRADPRPLQ